jgi:hypothetical protein
MDGGRPHIERDIIDGFHTGKGFHNIAHFQYVLGVMFQPFLLIG